MLRLNITSASSDCTAHHLQTPPPPSVHGSQAHRLPPPHHPIQRTCSRTLRGLPVCPPASPTTDMPTPPAQQTELAQCFRADAAQHFLRLLASSGKSTHDNVGARLASYTHASSATNPDTTLRTTRVCHTSSHPPLPSPYHPPLRSHPLNWHALIVVHAASPTSPAPAC
jgi:hypothetical protein